jgi:hypothetical protein
VTPTPPEPSINRKINQNNPTPEFMTFWENYPRKIAKQAALKAFTKLTPEQQAQAATTAAAYALSDLPEDEKFIPHAATWITRGSWADTFTPSKKRAAHLNEEAAKLRREQAHTEWLAQLEAEKQAAAPAPRCLQNAAVSFLQCKHPDCITAVANTEKEN